MDDEDYQALVTEVTAQLKSIGAADIADDQHYVDVNPETGEARLLSPKKRLFLMLQAFDRYLAIQDRSTFEKAQAIFRDSLDEGQMLSAVYLIPTEDGSEHEVDLSKAPDLSEVREQLSALTRELFRIDRDPPTPTSA